MRSVRSVRSVRLDFGSWGSWGWLGAVRFRKLGKLGLVGVGANRLKSTLPCETDLRRLIIPIHVGGFCRPATNSFVCPRILTSFDIFCSARNIEMIRTWILRCEFTTLQNDQEPRAPHFFELLHGKTATQSKPGWYASSLITRTAWKKPQR